MRNSYLAQFGRGPRSKTSAEPKEVDSKTLPSLPPASGTTPLRLVPPRPEPDLLKEVVDAVLRA